MNAMKLMVHYDKPELVLDVLRRRLDRMDLTCCTSYAALPEALEDEQPEILYSVRFAGTRGFPREAIVTCPSLKWVSVGGAGIDHLAPWDTSRLTVTNAAGVGAETMAQYAMASILHFTLGFHEFTAHQREGRWSDGMVASVRGLTLAILGLGNTGRAAAALAVAFGMRVIGMRANPIATQYVEHVVGPNDLCHLLEQADGVLVCLPLTPRTRHLLDRPQFAAMKCGCVLVDVSRGGIVRQAALLETLQNGRLKGAALDVFETEPLPRESPLWTMPNVIVTPHCSSVYQGWERRSIEMFCDNVERWRRGEKRQNVVDPCRGY
ncbi:MAG: D-2-hydroxyacid dehydrogenase [Hyphomicrobiales bacterium]|nr:D-2-hydroxyacid dehydrogenase [Hyphomicrobiales bacterium]